MSKSRARYRRMVVRRGSNRAMAFSVSWQAGPGVAVVLSCPSHSSNTLNGTPIAAGKFPCHVAASAVDEEIGCLP